MSHTLVVRPDAEQDLIEGRDWYEGQREGLGTEFLDAVDDVFDHIRDLPGLHAVEYKGVRRTGLNRFPYIVYYRLVGEVVEVIAVQQGGRNPRRWRSWAWRNGFSVEARTIRCKITTVISHLTFLVLTTLVKRRTAGRKMISSARKRWR